MSRAAKSGCIAAAIHLLFVGLIAAGVASNKSNGAELWVIAAYVDLPVYFLLGFVLQAASVLFYWDPPFIAAHDFLSVVFFRGSWERSVVVDSLRILSSAFTRGY
jgi:hypothetical protein